MSERRLVDPAVAQVVGGREDRLPITYTIMFTHYKQESIT